MALSIYLHKFDDAVCIDHSEDLSFPEDAFLVELQNETGVKVFTKDNIHTSYGPLGYINRFSTSWGDFDLEVQIEQVQFNVQFITKSKKLLAGINQTLIASSAFNICSSYEELRESYQ